MSDIDERTEYVAGLRQLADVLERNPDLRLPYTGSHGALLVITPPWTDHRAELAAWVKVLPGRKDGHVRNEMFDLASSFAGLKIKVICSRDKVCERVVVGTQTIWRCDLLLTSDVEVTR